MPPRLALRSSALDEDEPLAHLSDAERMFFVTLLLGRLIGWMRRQEGSSELRALLYMDEIFGYFPPNSNPPAKAVLLLTEKLMRPFQGFPQ